MRPFLSTAVLIFLITISRCHFEGQDKPLGEQNVENQSLPNIRFAPSGKDFYEKYALRQRPVIFKSSVSNWPSFKNWHNLTYLKHKYGKSLFNVDYAKTYTQQEIKQKIIPLEEFLEVYKEQNVTLESNISKSRMLNEIFLPPILQCNELHPSPENVHIVVTSGNISSPLYQVEADVVRVLLSGLSKVILYDSRFTKDLYRENFLLSPRMSNVMPHLVNLDNFPEFKHLPFYVGEMEAGDLMYIPKYWWVQVTSSGEHRVGVNMYFNPFDYSEELRTRGIDPEKDIVKTTEIHREMMSKQSSVKCTDKKISLSDVMKINQSDPKNLGLRIPKKNQRPDDVVLASGFKMPVLGLGTALLNESTTKAVKYALSIGYRLFDSAQGYPGSEEGIADAIMQSKLPRSEIFIVTKLHPRYLGYNTTLTAIDDSLRRLETSYIDLFLIHSKECDDFLLKCEEGEPLGTWQETWKAMEHALKIGKIRSLGVSNFFVNELKELMQLAEIPISVVQNWFDPIHQDVSVRKFCTENNIRYMGYSTLGGMWTQLGMKENPILTSSLLTDLSTHYDYVVSHVVLRWAIHKNVTVIPRSSSENHIAQNLRSLDISLSEYDVKDVDSMGSIMNDIFDEMYKEIDDAKDDAGESEGANAGDADASTNNDLDDGSKSTGFHAVSGANSEASLESKSSLNTDSIIKAADSHAGHSAAGTARISPLDLSSEEGDSRGQVSVTDKEKNEGVELRENPENPSEEKKGSMKMDSNEQAEGLFDVKEDNELNSKFTANHEL